jgi:hypothetical protein
LWLHKKEFENKDTFYKAWTEFTNYVSGDSRDSSAHIRFKNLFNPNFSELADNIISKIVKDLKEYDNPPFKVENGEICYNLNNN